MTAITDESQIQRIKTAYANHKDKWNLLDTDSKDGTIKADRNQSDSEITDFANGFENTTEGQAALEDIIKTMNEWDTSSPEASDIQQGLKDLVKGIRDGYVKDMGNGEISFTDEYSQSLLGGGMYYDPVTTGIFGGGAPVQFIDPTTNDTQKTLINQAYKENPNKWNKLDANGAWDTTDIADFAKGFGDTDQGTNALKTITKLIKQGKLDKDDIAVIKGKGVNSPDFVTRILNKDITLTEPQANSLGLSQLRDTTGNVVAMGFSLAPDGTVAPVQNINPQFGNANPAQRSFDSAFEGQGVSADYGPVWGLAVPQGGSDSTEILSRSVGPADGRRSGNPFANNNRLITRNAEVENPFIDALEGRPFGSR